MWASLLNKLKQMNWIILFCVLALGTLGVLMQYSAAGGNMQPWAHPHLVRFAVGLGLFLLVALLPISFFIRFAYPIYALCLVMLLFVEISGYVGMGAQRWINLGFLRIQPSEFMKIALILALARYFHFTHASDLSYPVMLLPAAALVAIPVLLILKQPNLGTATIVSFIAVVIAFMAGVRWYYFAGMIVTALIAAPIGWQFLHDYQKQRVLTFLDPTQDPLGSGYNIAQSMIAIGSGGFWGKGFLHGSQGQLDFLPEKQTDFIFTMVAEELGFAGAIGVLVLFAGILIYAVALSVRPRERFGGMVAAGLTALFFAHIFINIAMVMGMVPVVGVPLPFLSYGGTFMLTTLIASGLLMNIYIHRDTSLNRNIRSFF
ncbi:MAG: rod shape-determining protein RodA [Rickettsiales bacterium]|nr:rod shape-determining protein RodA [Rickettsiales bacterium]